MTSRWLVRLARRNVASVYFYGLLRSGMLALQWLTRRPDEPDLLFLGRLPRGEDELVLDIGANGGQSAVALGFIRPHARIISFEPVSALWPELGRVGKLLGRRFEFRKYGLGKSAGTFPLYIPVSGELPVTTRASISHAAAEDNCRELERQVGLPTRIQRVPVEVREGDSEALTPMAIKIDVEGVEFEVIQGLARTIERHRPVVLLEKSQSFEDCARFFAEAGYVVFTADGAGPGETALQGLSTRNWIACPPALSGYLTAGTL